MTAVMNFYGNTSAAGLFSFDQNGLVQGEYQPNPSARYSVAGAFVDTSVTAPIYGGILVTEFVPSADQTTKAVGPRVDAALTVAAATAFVVSNHMYNAVNVSGPLGANAVPYVTGGNSVQLARLGSGLEVAVAIDPAAVAALQTGAVNAQFSWDLTNQKIIALTEGATALDVTLLRIEPNSKVITIDGTSGLPVWSTGPAALIRL